MAKQKGTHAVLTGPIDATLVLADGTKVDASPQVVYVDTEEQATELADLIGRHYEANGHPAVDGDFDYNREG